MSDTTALDVKRYDRQIRLWGLETQAGLQGARILLLRVTGLCNEVAKNLVLAGVGHVTIQDPGEVAPADIETGAVFYFTQADVGRSRAEVLAERLRALNPQVSIEACSDDVRDLGAEALRDFSYIIGTHGAGAVGDVAACAEALEPADAEPPSKKARTNGKDTAPSADAPRKAASNGAHVVLPMRAATEGLPKMIAAGTQGLHGFCVLDLRTRAYLPLKKPKKTDDDGAAANSSAAEPKRMRVTYPSVQQAMAVDWPSLGPRVPPFYGALQLLCELQEHLRGPADPACATAEGRLQWLEERRQAKLREAQRPETWLSAGFVAQVGKHAQAELAPVCAVVGGVVASEVIKIISGKGAPINNAFFFDALQSSEGCVQRLGPSFSCPWGVDGGKPAPLDKSE